LADDETLTRVSKVSLIIPLYFLLCFLSSQVKASLKPIINACNFSQRARTLLNEIAINHAEFRNIYFLSLEKKDNI